jgi:hypothetical protein
LLVIGILGAYVGRIYEEVQRRPLYTVAREVNFTLPEKNEATRTLPPPIPPRAKGEGSGGETA